MSDIEPLVSRLKLPPVCQLGFVVRDLDKAVEYYSSNFGIGPFRINELDLDATHYQYRGKPGRVRIRAAFASLGSVDMEVAQLMEGDCVYGEFLEQRGEGLQHMGFRVTDFDDAYRRMTDAGFSVVLWAEIPSPARRFTLRAYTFDTDRVGGVCIELLSTPPAQS
jgi:4-hydroxyphenylpyruvate dioxygenase-like putative hemolysin